MATELTVVTIDLDGIIPERTAVVDAGMYFENNGRCFAYIEGGGGGLWIKFDSPTECTQGFAAEHDISISPAAGILHMVGPFPKSRFDDGSNLVQISVEGGANADGMKIQILNLA